MFERFTDRARKVMALANQQAQQFRHEYIWPEHILLGLIIGGKATSRTIFRNHKIDPKQVRREVEAAVREVPDSAKFSPTPGAKRIIEFAIEEAIRFGHNYVGTEHLLLGLIRADGAISAKILFDHGLQVERVREDVLKLKGAGPADRGAGA